MVRNVLGLQSLEVWARLRFRRVKAIPVVDPDGRLVGMVPQSDLIAALYVGCAMKEAAVSPGEEAC